MKKILIIEDEKILAEMYLMKLRQFHFDLVLAESAEDGEKALKKGIPDLIILDILLPGDSGLDFLKKMVEKEEYRSIPVVILSNYDDPGKKKTAFSLGAKDYLIKSNYTPQEIVEKLKRYLK